MPEEIAAIAYQNKEVVYGILFRATAETLRTIAADPQHLGAEIGFLAVLHSWGQNLLFHPHLHCVVPGGGLAPDGKRWIACRPGFFLPVEMLQGVKELELALVKGGPQVFEEEPPKEAGEDAHQDPKAFAKYLAPLGRMKWIVYAKPPFGGPEQVLRYLGRYTHRVAISNNRLLNIDHGKVTFRWKDYRHDRQKIMTMEADEFIRRFLLHVLPDGFQRIRHYGFLSHRYRQAKLALCRQLLGVVLTLAGALQPPDTPDYRDLYEKLSGKSLRECPVCRRGQMVVIAILSASDRAPPLTTS